MKVTLVQSSPRLNRSNLREACNIIKLHVDKSDLIIFAELSLNGYLLQDKLFEDAWKIEELNELCELSKNIDIVVGAALREDNLFRNSALYFSKGRLLSKHNKVYLPNYGMFEEARYFESGKDFECFDNSHVKISMLVCEDLWNVEATKELYEKNPDLILVLAASPARGFEEGGLLIQDQWYSLLKSLSLHCDAKVVFVNRVGFEDGLGFWGGSCVIDKNAKFLCQLPKYDEIIKTVEI
jgi:predicted amidohydrolase